MSIYIFAFFTRLCYNAYKTHKGDTTHEIF